jgi:hypothetical protein
MGHTLLHFSIYFFSLAGQFATFVQLPICSRCAIHFNVLRLSRLNRNAIFTFSGSLAPFAKLLSVRLERTRTGQRVSFLVCSA